MYLALCRSYIKTYIFLTVNFCSLLPSSGELPRAGHDGCFGSGQSGFRQAPDRKRCKHSPFSNHPSIRGVIQHCKHRNHYHFGAYHKGSTIEDESNSLIHWGKNTSPAVIFFNISYIITQSYTISWLQCVCVLFSFAFIRNLVLPTLYIL